MNLDGVYFKAKNITSYEETHVIIINITWDKAGFLIRRVHQEDVITLNLHGHNNKIFKYMKWQLEKGNIQIHKYSEDVSSYLSIMHKTRKKKISEFIKDFNNRVKQIGLMEINRTLHPTKAKYTLSSSAQRLVICWAINKYEWIQKN